MGDSVIKKMQQVSAKEIADVVAGNARLSPEQMAAADVDGDGDIDATDVELMAQAQLKLANKISGAIIGMEQLTPEEKAVAERNGDGFVNLTDGHRLADDARMARAATPKLNQPGNKAPQTPAPGDIWHRALRVSKAQIQRCSRKAVSMPTATMNMKLTTIAKECALCWNGRLMFMP
jgi:hypothetical protein